MNPGDADTFARCIAVEGVALFPSDTVYGLATEPDSKEGVRRLYRLKGRSDLQPAAVMFFALDLALAALPELGPRTQAALGRLLPGPLTVLVPNPAQRYPLACGPSPERLGIRVPELTEAFAPLTAMRWPVLQSSANRHGQPDANVLSEVDPAIRAGVDLQIDGGTLRGVASTVVDLCAYEEASTFQILREGAVPEATLADLLEE